MTEAEKLAEEYIDKEYSELKYEKCERKDFVFTFHEIKEMGKQAFLAGYETGKPKWHDLRKDPNDLPKVKESILSEYLLLLIKLKGSGSLFYNLGRYNFLEKEFEYSHIMGINEVIAWCEIPRLEEELS